MLAVELVSDPDKKTPDADLTGRVNKYCHSQGLVTLTCGTFGNVFRFLPPLAAGDDLLSEGLDILDEALSVALAMGVRRADAEAGSAKALPRVKGRDQDLLVQRLPFPLTAGQNEVVAEITRDMARPFDLGEVTLDVMASIGIASTPRDGSPGRCRGALTSTNQDSWSSSGRSAGSSGAET